MKTYNNIVLKALSFSLVAGLAACGGKNTAPVAVAPTPVANPTPAATDYVASTIIPQLQAMYGNIFIYAANGVSVSGVAFPANGWTSWAAIYPLVLQIAARSPNCASNVQPNSPFWAQVNYSCLSQMLNSQDLSILSYTQVTFEKYQQQMNNASTGNLKMVIDLIFNNSYQYVNQTQQYQYYGTPSYGYVPYSNGYYNGNGVSGGLNISGGNGGFGLSGAFNFAH